MRPVNVMAGLLVLVILLLTSVGKTNTETDKDKKYYVVVEVLFNIATTV